MKSVDQILKVFHKTISQLDIVHVKNLEEAATKRSKASELVLEATHNDAEAEKALRVIKKLEDLVAV